MGTFSIWHWLIVLAVVLLLFGGGGKIPKLMRDMGQGINAYRKGLKEEDKKKAADGDDKKAIEQEPSATASVSAEGEEQPKKAAEG